jgi:hypothetical protein
LRLHRDPAEGFEWLLRQHQNQGVGAEEDTAQLPDYPCEWGEAVGETEGAVRGELSAEGMDNGVRGHHWTEEAKGPVT